MIKFVFPSQHDRVNIQIRVAIQNATNPIDTELDFFIDNSFHIYDIYNIESITFFAVNLYTYVRMINILIPV